MSKPGQTPSQTIGPFFAYGLTPEQYDYPFASIAGPVIASGDVSGPRIRIEGRVLDGEGKAISDAMVEIWQADGQGRYAHPADGRATNSVFTGFGRCGTGTDPENRFWFETVKPASVDGLQAPHVNIAVFMRGLLTHAYTRLYFPDEAEMNAVDPVLGSVPEDRRGTLIAHPVAGDGVPCYRFDIHMQGSDETVFFDV